MLVSVLMPVYNCERYVAAAIESVLSQTVRDFELVVADDRSDDRTLSIVESYARKDSRIVAYRNPNNLGIAANRNALVKRAKYRYVAWQDGDDLSLPARLERQLRVMEGDERVAICGCHLQFFDENGDLGVRRYATNDAELRKTIFRYSPVAQPGAMIRRSVFDDVGGYDEALVGAEDLDMSFRIGSKYRFANVDEVLLRYRVHRQSITQRRIKQLEWDTIRVRRRYRRGHGYRETMGDRLYGWAHLASMAVVPSTWKLRLFDFFRNARR